MIKLKEILKKKKLFFLASVLIAEEQARPKCGFIQDKYYTSIIKNGKKPYKFIDGVVDWDKEESSLASKYAKQVYEIERLHTNYNRLNSLKQSKKISSFTRSVIDKYEKLLLNAIKVYAVGNDDAKFDRTIQYYNDFVDSHFMYADFHKTFRVVKRNEIDVKIYGAELITNYRLALVEENTKKYEKLIDEGEKEINSYKNKERP